MTQFDLSFAMFTALGVAGYVLLHRWDRRLHEYIAWLMLVVLACVAIAYHAEPGF